MLGVVQEIRVRNTIVLHVTIKRDKMRKDRKGEMKLQVALCLCVISGTAFGSVFDWWTMDTICQIDNTECYAGLSAGLDSSEETGWDEASSCRGKKYICADALTDGNDRITKTKSDIERGIGIDPDFDTNVYVASDDCYGARRTRDGGTSVLVNGRYAKVWCNGVLSNPTEFLPNGEITSGVQPTCSSLAYDGYVAVLNGRCYGKYYNPENYTIECDGETPTLIVLNGANYMPGRQATMTVSAANTLFGKMTTSANLHRTAHFNN